MPFEIFKQDTEYVILLINYLIEKGESEPSQSKGTNNNNSEQRVRVNDKTASGGWF